jgi:hypothetical protein
VPSQRQLQLSAYAAALTISVAVWYPSLGNGFVWDDMGNIVNNRNLDLPGLRFLGWAFTTFHLGHFQPLTWLSLCVDRCLSGDNALGYHLTNLLLHVINIILLLGLARRLLARRGVAPTAALLGALAAALVFGLHPLRVETVGWITERRHLLAALFYLLGLHAYLAAAHGPPLGRHRLASYGAFILSMLCDAWVISLPVVLLCLDAVIDREPRWRQLLLEKLPYAAIALAAMALALTAQHDSGALLAARGHDWPNRLMQAGYGATYYWVRSVYWCSLSPYVPIRAGELYDAWHWAALLLSVGVTLAAMVRARRWRLFAAAWIGYLALVSPVLGLAQSGLQAVADRYSYLAL